MTRIDRTKAERCLAFLASQQRPDWSEHNVLVALRKVSDRPLGDVWAATLAAATSRTDQSPAVIARNGDHWQALDRMHTPTSTASSPSTAGRRCNVCGRHEPACRAAAAKTGDPHQFTLPTPASLPRQVRP